ncbi:hypothetical protein TNCV_3451141 [Trichonephila clavipes]|uniref:Uncharacterized protein n=1 Tax=Trichonephila clavipes TaxID=2585209 RepID=A0A8X6WLV5_TRICX|nr:hypothetical protein TNCV_3451141 [Trichonephila clavipes]
MNSKKKKKKTGESCPLDQNDLKELTTVYDNKEVDTGEVEGEVELLTADLIREGLKFATSMEQRFIAHEPE